MDVSTFYALFSTTCFTLTGLWWNVVRARKDWTSDPPMRRTIGGIYLSFLLPALMGLFAQVGGTESPLLWRMSFVVIAIVTACSVGMAQLLARTTNLPMWHALLLLCFHATIAMAVVCASAIDLEHMILPNELTLGGALLCVVTSPVRSVGLVSSLIGAATGFAVAYAARPDDEGGAAPPGEQVSFAQAQAVVEQRCAPCHSENPTNESFSTAPKGIRLDTPDEIAAQAEAIERQAVDSTTMPLGNVTGMTDAERDLLGAWIAQGANTDQ